MAGAAAIFDLDRTLLRGSSTPVITEALHAAGLSPRASFPGQAVAMRIYEVVGETLPAMLLARAAARQMRGVPVDQVAAAAAMAAERLEGMVAPYAAPLLEMHRDAGRALVLASTTPRDLIAPLAERLGFEHVVATTYATEDGRYTGSLDGGFVWAAGKLNAIRKWAADNAVDLEESWAYSDSIYDLPLLAAVGHPTAVNPDYRLLAAAVLRRWPVLHLDSPTGVPKILGAEPLDLLRGLSSRAAFPYARFDIAGTENIPRHGPVVLAFNHRSYFDPAVVALVSFQAGRNPRGLAKKELFDAPVIGQLMRLGGAICVDRTGDRNQALAEAEAALRSGELLLIAPQGTIPRGEAFFDPKLVGKTGAARLAAATGAPVIPLGIWGTEHVWPRSARLPNIANVVNPPTVRARVGPPVTGLSGKDPKADTERIMDAIVNLLPPEARLPRIPTAEELARTMPPGRVS
ncbi:MAG: HAD-IB family hydrolase [Acidimicrobiales bacterium]